MGSTNPSPEDDALFGIKTSDGVFNIQWAPALSVSVDDGAAQKTVPKRGVAVNGIHRDVN